MSALSHWVWHPLWDIKDRSVRLATLRELRRSQWQSHTMLRERQLLRLRSALAYAHANVPYYRRLMEAAGVDPKSADERALKSLPILTKADIRARSNELLAQPWRGREAELSIHKTGGSTGVSLKVLFDPAWEQVRAGDALRANEWAGWYHGMKLAAVWGNPPQPASLKERVYASLHERTVYLDTMSLNEQSLGAFVDLWRRERPEIVFGHSHSIYMLARYLEEQHVNDLRPRGIVATSMMLMQHERKVIERVFGCAVTNRYGCEEVGLIAAECERHDGMHLNIEHLVIEFLRADGSDAAPGEEGAIVVTDLFNRAMPLIRYRIEDMGVPADRTCPCGRGLPLMEHVTGRVADYLKRRDGSLVAGVSLVERTLTEIPGIEQMQIVQDAVDRVALNIVRDAAFTPGSEERLVEEIRVSMGPGIEVDVNCLGEIPRERSGKYRFSICRI